MRYIIFAAIFLLNLYAENSQAYNQNLTAYLHKLFYKRLSKYDISSYDKYFNEEKFKKALEYLKNPKLYKEITILDGDPEEGIPMKKEKIKVPDYKKVVSLLYKSVKTEHNPVAAFYGLYITNNVYAENKPIYFLMRREFAKVLYDYSQNCDGYLYYGKYLMNGIGGKREAIKAFEVFKKGYDKCLDKEYYKLLIENNMNMLQRKIENAK